MKKATTLESLKTLARISSEVLKNRVTCEIEYDFAIGQQGKEGQSIQNEMDKINTKLKTAIRNGKTNILRHSSTLDMSETPLTLEKPSMDLSVPS